MSDDHDRIVRASEIGQYVYCAHAWWLGSIQGLPSSRAREMEAGTANHARHGRETRLSLWLNRLAYLVLLAALVLGLIWLSGLLVD